MSTTPVEVFIGPAEKLVYLTPELNLALPESQNAFDVVEDAFTSDSEAYLKRLEESLFTFTSSTGAKVDCSLVPGKGSELLIMWAPFSDSAPSSSAETMYQYITEEDVSKTKAAPNSWNQLTKSGVVAELLKATGREMPVLTIFSPLPSVPHNAYTGQEYKQIRNGNFTPASRITSEAIRHAQDRLHGPKGETQINELHFHGASLGASSAIGAANGLLAVANHAIRTVTAQELIVAPRNVFPDLAARFTVKATVGEVSDAAIDETWAAIEEPLVRQEIERRGNEPMMFGRMLQGMSKVSRLKGLTRPGRNETPFLIENLVRADVSVLLPLAENSGLTYDTPKYLPDAGEQIVHVRAIKGEQANHLVDEHVALTALLAVINIRSS
ncbi:hypothetical protein BH09PAT4_BH09PAT4_00530 [soil metagenome]